MDAMTDWMLYAGIFLITFFAMEGVAWWTHKYVMHGFLWSLHRSHHEPRKGFWELNDAFGLFFSLVSMGLIYWGWQGPTWLIFVGLGLAGYGVVYFLVHDILVHRRVAIRINPKKGYLRRLYQAHKLHHAVDGKDGCVSFGFIFAPSPDHLAAEIKRLAPVRQWSSRVDAKHGDARAQEAETAP